MIHRCVSRVLVLVLIAQSLTLGGAQAYADDEAPYRGPIHSQSGVEGRVQRFLDAYREYEYKGRTLSDEDKERLSLLPAEEAWEEINNLAIEMKADKVSKVDRMKAKLCGDVSERDNGRGPLGKLAKRMDAATTDIMGSDPETYQEIVALLLTGYYASPGDREGISVLLHCVSEKVRGEVLASQVEWDPLYKDMLVGTMVAWGLIAAWDLRGGWKGIKSDAKWTFNGLGRGFKGLVNRFVKDGKVAGQELEQFEKKSGMARKVFNAARERMGQKLGQAREAWANKGALVRSVPGALVRGAKAFPKKTFTTLKSLAWDLVRAGATGGLVGGLWGLNEDAIPVKVDPLDVLQAMQVLIAAELEGDVREFDADVQKHLTKSNAEEYFRKCMHLTFDARGLVTSAPELMSRMPWPHLTEDIAALKDRSTYRQLTRPERTERVAYFVDHSDELRKLVKKLEKEINQDAEAAGLGDEKYVSLGATLPRLMGLAEQIAGLLSAENLAPPAPEPVLP